MMNPQSRNKANRSSAFTLIELLVVVGIIGLLVSLLVPSLQKARVQARNTKCITQLRDLMLSTQMYIQDYARLPPLNNDPDEGAWQYNYLIFDGRDYDQCFGPLAQPDGPIKYTQQLFCPFQTNPFHRFATTENPWPPVRNLDTRAGYARRHGLTGKALTEFKLPQAVMADLIHEPDIIKTGHETGVNTVFSDGHAIWIRDPGLLTHNELASPFDPLDNPIVDELWQMLDRSGR